jgi:hypothetical protein
VDAPHYAEVELTPQDQPVRGWRVRCMCSWTGPWRGSLSDAVAEYDEHLADSGIPVFEGRWWERMPRLVPVEEVTPDPVAMGTACRIWAVEAVSQLERLCRWIAKPEDATGR